ncbi:MAG TPA: endonuclease domain-containing protein [Mucilaginibacter sp.]|jgi:very-short-patch-repair endonuclease|nr:endonuclease domain-containing protein [Mucilaginibacter sp.]
MPNIIDLCRDLRKQQTPAEELLWQHLRNRKFSRHKFLRQHLVCVSSAFGKNLYYIPDFYCHKAKLVIEADGPIHLFKKEYDKNRDEVLSGLGLGILRFTNEAILYNTNEVLSAISNRINGV